LGVYFITEGMHVDVSADEIKAYRATAQRRWEEDRRQLTLRHKQAWALARQAAELLRAEYGIDQAMAFGSLVRGELFHPRSDIDLVVWGLHEAHYYRAIAQLLALDPAFEIDLLRGEELPSSLRAGIQQEGVEL
jgi:uncharacterized protein